MGAKLRHWALLLLALAPLALVGCRGPTEMFNCLDTYCFLPDWTNCNSCDSECWRKDGYNYHWVCPCQNPTRCPPVYQ